MRQRFNDQLASTLENHNGGHCKEKGLTPRLWTREPRYAIAAFAETKGDPEEREEEENFVRHNVEYVVPDHEKRAEQRLGEREPSLRRSKHAAL